MVRALVAIGWCLLVAGCGSGSGPVAWDTEAQFAEPVGGLAIAVDVERAEYRPGERVQVKVVLKNTLLKERYLDIHGSWDNVRLAIEGPDGLVEPEAREAGPAVKFIPLAPDASIEHIFDGPAADTWAYKPFQTPGTYRLRAVYEVALSDQWNRLSVAGGKYEGKVLWVGRVESAEATFEVKAPEKRK